VTPVRQILRWTTHLVSRRCSERRFFLKPSARTAAIFPYALALVSARYGILVHAYCVLSNHYHLLLTDPFGRLPDFQRDLNSLIAKATNAALGRWDGFWERTSYSAVALVGSADVFDKLLYVLANPVAAGLVRRAAQWPGHLSDPRRIGAGTVTIPRPKEFFDEEGDMPASVEFELTPPPGFENDSGFVERLLEALREAEESEAAKLAEQGRSFMGATAVRAQSFFARPAPGEPRRVLSPHLACRNKWKRIEALQRLVEFRDAYRYALAAWRNGLRDVLFPPGTWQMRVLHGAAVAGAG
jgi:REP element-mobilizing transposase RayT